MNWYSASPGNGEARVNSEQLEQLIAAHERQIYDYLHYLGAGKTSVIEDLVQDTFLAAFQSPNAPTLSEPTKVAAWLRGIARNRFLAYCHRARTGKVRADSASLEQAEAAWSLEYLRADNGSEYLDAFRVCLQGLTEKQTSLIRMYYTENYSRKELADELGMSDDGVKTFLRRTRAALAACVKRRLSLAGTPSGNVGQANGL